MSSAIGSARIIQIKEGWTEPSILFTAVIAPPSSKKSPAFKLALKPVYELQKKLKKQYEIEKENFVEGMDRWEADKENNDRPTKPIFPRNLINDATLEAIAKILAQNPKGLLMGMDELAGWIKSMDQYRGGKGGDKDKWLSMWSGTPFSVDRSSKDEPHIIENPCINTTGGIQPERLKCLRSKDHDGFIERILLSFPKPIKDDWVEEGVSKEIVSNYQKRYNELYDLKPSTQEDGSFKPIVLKFTPQAKKFWVDFFKVNCDEIWNESNPSIKAAFKKIEAYSARFSLVVQLMSYPQSTCIDKEAVEVAVALAEYFKANVRKVYALIENEKVRTRILIAINRIKSNGGEISARDCYTKKIANTKNSKSALKLFEELQQLGHGTIMFKKNSSGGRQTIIFKLR